jgi:hypothetical protein
MGTTLQFEDVRKLGKVGRYSYCVTLPREIVQALGWRSRQRLVVGMEGDRIVVRDWKPGRDR